MVREYIFGNNLVQCFVDDERELQKYVFMIYVEEICVIKFIVLYRNIDELPHFIIKLIFTSETFPNSLYIFCPH